MSKKLSVRENTCDKRGDLRNANIMAKGRNLYGHVGEMNTEDIHKQ